MSISVTAAGSAGTFGTPVASLSSSAYNQAAGHCIYVSVIVNTGGGAVTSCTILDTAGNNFTQSIQYNSTEGGTFIIVWTALNCLGNTNNVITLTFVGSDSSYSTLTYYDIGGCSGLDVVTYAPTASSTNSQSVTISTTYASEALLTTLFNTLGQSSFTATAPTGFTVGSVVSNFSLSAYEIVSSIQSGVTLTWSGSTASAGLDMVVVSFVKTTNIDDGFGMSFGQITFGNSTTTKF